MATIRRDYRVKRREISEVFQEAANVRKLLEQFVRGKWFDVVEAVNFLVGRKVSDKGELSLIFVDELPSHAPAQVGYNPLELKVTRKIWADANQTLNFDDWVYARWVLCHELGHVFLHDHNAKQFSNDGTERAKAPPQERSEDQADWFGMFLACPIHQRLTHLDPYGIATIYNIPDDIAEEILEQAALYVDHNHIVPNSAKCPECSGPMEKFSGQVICRTCQPPVVMRL